MSKFPERLREAMRSRNMTQLEFAKLIEVSPGTLSSYLREGSGRKVPTLDTLERISDILGVTIGWLTGENISDNSLHTYADLFEALGKICDAKKRHIFYPFATTDKSGTYAGIKTHDRIFVDFLTHYKKVTDLYTAGTIDKEMLEAWVQKRIRDFKNIPLDDDEAIL